jgi:hypothetical protein
MLKEFKWQEFVIYAFTAFLGLCVFFLCFYLSKNSVDITDFYAEKMRASMFSGFLTLGSFLLALKTGIVIKIKEGVYDRPDYQKRILSTPELSGKITIYGPLRRLSRMLSVSVMAALTTSALQLTLGLIEDWRASAVCLAMAAFSISVLLASFITIQSNLGTWFDLMEIVSNCNRSDFADAAVFQAMPTSSLSVKLRQKLRPEFYARSYYSRLA